MLKMLEEYAHLLIEVGLNLQKGQYLVINSPVICADFARLCVKAAYEVGAKQVIMQWRDDYISRQYYLNASDEVFDQVFQWDVDRNLGLAKLNAARLSISASDPELLKGVDPGRLEREDKSLGEANREYHEMMMNSSFPWCVASIPVPSWAKKVFPELPEDEAMERLWQEIFKAVRIDSTGGAVERWREHCKYLKQKRELLNEYNFKYLHYSNSLGTDLMVELPEDHIWMAGSELSKSGIEFVANMPTEEVFTAPKRDGVNGKIVASRPLVEGGNIIDGFYMILKDGVITEVHAEKGEEYLKKAISIDEGASRFGEVALVPYDSPISNSGVLFYNTLFDENASCHFAFGAAYPCVKDGDKMTSEQLLKKGLNDSITHCDFMVGTKDLSIIGITHDGRRIAVFENGNFAI
ncbi:MAG: aminopeptidase [Christensenellaceae bacterium]|nr:aminopeptidase [Christensenellaceae bacterium]